MKKIACFLLSCFAIHANAATSITTATVSGHWTMAGSPYDIYNDITINGAQALVIDTGVDVVFHGAYRLLVNGSLVASGNAAHPINFKVADTTGFSTIDATSAGGWHGIQFPPYSGTGTDASVMSYCNITHTKFSPVENSVLPELHTLFINRNLSINNCNFYGNRESIGTNIDLVYISTLTGQLAEFNACSFYNNSSMFSVLQTIALYGGSTSVHDSKFYNNVSDRNVIGASWAKLSLTGNEVYNNTLTGTSSMEGIVTIGGNAKILANKIHHNTCRKNGAITANEGFIDIIGNLICNNQHIDAGSCGIVDGGGAMNLAWNSGSPHANTFFNVRNNIIANNFSPFQGGGIKVYFADAVIANNQIVNNVSSDGAGIYLRDDASSNFTVENNVLWGNAYDTFGAQAPALTAYLFSGTLKYEHNYTEHPSFYEMQLYGSGYTLTGDTTTNIVAHNPGMIAPTTDCKLSTNAMTAKFALSASSPCIDKGDTTGIVIEAKDYAGNARLYGSKIDIGASEYSPFNALGSATITAPAQQLHVFPNPASNHLFISAPAANGTISMMDLSGKVLQQTNVTNALTTLDIHTAAPGIYFILWNNDGEKAVQKIVVE